MLLGSRTDDRLTEDERNGLIYCFLVSTLTNRYGGSADSILSRDIPVALADEEPQRKLLDNIGYGDRRLVIDADDLRGRTVTSPYFMMSFLAAHHNGATDWWDRNRLQIIRAGTRWLEYHHIHPQSTLKDDYQRGQINELANLAFISERANKHISNRPPASYFSELSDEELAGHYVPTGPEIEWPVGYLTFLDARRRLLAEAMTALLDRYAPPWLSEVPDEHNPLTGSVVRLQWHDSPTAPPALSVFAQVEEGQWTATLDANELSACVEAAEDSLSSDLMVAGTSVPFRVEEEQISVDLGPVTLTGSVAEWQAMIQRERNEATDQPPSTVPTSDWTVPVLAFPIADTQ